MVERTIYKYDNPIKEVAYAARFLLECLVINSTPAVVPDDAEKLARAEEGALREVCTRLRAVDKAMTLRREELRYQLTRLDEERISDPATAAAVEEIQQRERELPRKPKGA